MQSHVQLLLTSRIVQRETICVCRVYSLEIRKYLPTSMEIGNGECNSRRVRHLRWGKTLLKYGGRTISSQEQTRLTIGRREGSDRILADCNGSYLRDASCRLVLYDTVVWITLSQHIVGANCPEVRLC